MQHVVQAELAWRAGGHFGGLVLSPPAGGRIEAVLFFLEVGWLVEVHAI